MGKHTKWVWSDALEMQKPLDNGLTVSLAPSYVGRGAWNTLRWECLVLADGDDVGRFDFTIEDVSKSDRKRWVIARRIVDLMSMDDINNRIAINAHAVPAVMSGNYDGKIVADIWED